MMEKGIFLDNHTCTRPSERALAKMQPFLAERWGSPSAPHQRGQQLMPAVEEALKGIYALLGANERDAVLFTSSGAEGVNHLINSTYFDLTIPTGRNQFVTSAIGEAPALMAVARLEQLHCVGKMAPADATGRITAEAVAEELSPRTALVSLSWANGLTGVINPIYEIADLCQERGVRLHLEASHALGKLFCDWTQVPAHFMTFSGDSLHAPPGTGALFIREDVKCSPFILGGSEQAGLRAGSYSVAALAALGEAVREALDTRALVCTEVARLRAKLEEGLLNRIPEAVVFFQEQERLPNCTAVGFRGVVNESLLYLLNRKGVYASIGGGVQQQLKLVLTASGISPVLANGAVSFALSRETTEDEIDRAIELVVEAVEQLRKCSSHLHKDIV
jgi:cysteine desulfurase